MDNSQNVFNNCEINIDLNRSEKCVIVTTNVAIQATTFIIIDAKLISVVNLSTQDNAKLLEQTKSGFKKTMSQNKYEPKVPKERQNQ